MKNVEENVAYVEYASPSCVINPSKLNFYADEPSTVYVTKQQLEIVEFITKCNDHFLRELMNVPGNSSYHRLITND